MEMDKSWINKPRVSSEYEKGLNEFIHFAFAYASTKDLIRCPSRRYGFKRWQTREAVHDHLICTQFPSGYTMWFWHGESITEEINDTSNVSHDTSVSQDTLPSQSLMQDMIHDAFGVSRHQGTEAHELAEEVELGIHGLHQRHNEDDTDFADLVKYCNEKLYKGCSKYSKLSFLIKLHHIKCFCRMSDKAMSMILELIYDAFEHAKIPSSVYEAKKIIKKLGLNYSKIDACPNDCMLYWGDDTNRESCKVCHTSRWKVGESESNMRGGGKKKRKKKKQPAKVLRYFPLKPRLQRLYMSSKIAAHMRWHAKNIKKDGLMRHPRDCEAWKSFDSTYPEFASEPRNVRLGLASDGFNPFGTWSTNYSIWPTILILYNLPPWMCMKQTSVILSMIIPGKRMPGNDIDVYLQPLVKELEELWIDKVETYDSSSVEMFTLHAALTWTISDFPDLGTLSR